MKCSKSRSHLTDEDRFLIEKSWNIPDGRRHPSVRAIAKSLGLAEATLRRELKRGCADGKYCMVLNDKGKRRWQYFLYSAEAAILDARWQASAKGPRIKLTTSHISTIRKYLKEWPSIPSAYEAMLNDNPNESFPSLRTFQYHAQKRNWSARVNGRDLYNPYGRRPKHAPPRTAGNHNPTHRIDDLPEEVRKYRVKGYAQMDTIHSGARGKGGLLTMILPADGHKAFVRRLKDLRQETVHRALRSIARECRRSGRKAQVAMAFPWRAFRVHPFPSPPQFFFGATDKKSASAAGRGEGKRGRRKRDKAPARKESTARHATRRRRQAPSPARKQSAAFLTFATVKAPLPHARRKGKKRQSRQTRPLPHAGRPRGAARAPPQESAVGRAAPPCQGPQEARATRTQTKKTGGAHQR